jgi:hypothetical protein
MAISSQTMQTLNQAFKVQYADQMLKLIPEMAVLNKQVPFVKSDGKHGSVYIQPVILTLDHGMTAHGQNDNNLSLQSPVGAAIRQASITANSYSARSWVSQTVLERCGGSEQSFVEGTSYFVESLTRSFSHMLEGIDWYGQDGLASAVYESDDITLRVAAGNAAPFLFLGGEGMPIDIYDTTGVTLVATTEISKVLIGSNDAGTTSNSGITLTIKSGAALVDGTTYKIFRKGFKGNEHAGLKQILTSSNIFGIDSTSYGLWKANVDSAAGAFTYEKLSLAVSRAIGRGLTGPLSGWARSVTLRQAIPSFVSIADGSSATFKARNFPNAQDVNKLQHGVKSISFICDSVEVNLEASEFIKGSDVFCLDMNDVMYVGSAPAHFVGRPGATSGTEEFLWFRPDEIVAEMRLFADRSPFCGALNRHLLFSNITPTT